jgi:thioredoxin 1
MSEVREINDLNFETEVLQSDTPFLLDFGAAWCGPCKALKPVLEALAIEHAGSLKVGKIDVDLSPDVATRFGIRGMPTLVVFRAGSEVRRRVGAGSKSALLALIDP